MATNATDKTTIDFDFPDWGGETIVMALKQSVAINSAGEVISKKDYPVTLGVNGVATNEDFPTPDSTGDSAWLYNMEMPDGVEQEVTLSYAASAQSAAVLLAAAQSSATSSDISALIANKQDKALTAVDDNLAKFLDGETVDAGLDFKMNATFGTPETTLTDEVSLQHGQELHIYARNSNGSDMSNFEIARLDGSVGERIAIVKALADSVTNARAAGIVTETTIAQNTEGYITPFGRATGDTSAWSEGDTLYLSDTTAGLLVNTAPTWPDIIVGLATVERSHPSAGVIFFYIWETPAGAHEKAAAAQAAAEAASVPNDAAFVTTATNYTTLAADGAKSVLVSAAATVILADGMDSGFQQVIHRVGTGAVTISATTTLNRLTDGTGYDTIASATLGTTAVVTHLGSNVWLITGDFS